MICLVGSGSWDPGANRALKPDHIDYVTAVTADVSTLQLHLLSRRHFMSTAIVERIAEQPKKADLVLVSPPSVPTEQWDPHPLVPVFVAGAISLIASVAFIGSVLAWLALRHSGVMAP